MLNINDSSIKASSAHIRVFCPYPPNIDEEGVAKLFNMPRALFSLSCLKYALLSHIMKFAHENKDSL